VTAFSQELAGALRFISTARVEHLDKGRPVDELLASRKQGDQETVFEIVPHRVSHDRPPARVASSPASMAGHRDLIMRRA
jgi:hypothetical protein